MKVVSGILITGILTFALMRIGPWWICGVITFLCCLLLRLKSGLAFLVGFLGVALSWGIVSGWIDANNSSILSTRIGTLFGGMTPMLVIFVTAVIGGLIGGFGGMTGATLSKIVFANRDQPHDTA